MQSLKLGLIGCTKQVASNKITFCNLRVYAIIDPLPHSDTHRWFVIHELSRALKSKHQKRIECNMLKSQTNRGTPGKTVGWSARTSSTNLRTSLHIQIKRTKKINRRATHRLVFKVVHVQQAYLHPGKNQLHFHARSEAFKLQFVSRSKHSQTNTHTKL